MSPNSVSPWLLSGRQNGRTPHQRITRSPERMFAPRAESVWRSRTARTETAGREPDPCTASCLRTSLHSSGRLRLRRNTTLLRRTAPRRTGWSEICGGLSRSCRHGGDYRSRNAVQRVATPAAPLETRFHAGIHLTKPVCVANTAVTSRGTGLKSRRSGAGPPRRSSWTARSSSRRKPWRAASPL